MPKPSFNYPRTLAASTKQEICPTYKTQKRQKLDAEQKKNYKENEIQI